MVPLNLLCLLSILLTILIFNTMSSNYWIIQIHHVMDYRIQIFYFLITFFTTIIIMYSYQLLISTQKILILISQPDILLLVRSIFRSIRLLFHHYHIIFLYVFLLIIILVLYVYNSYTFLFPFRNLSTNLKHLLDILIYRVLLRRLCIILCFHFLSSIYLYINIFLHFTIYVLLFVLYILW